MVALRRLTRTAHRTSLMNRRSPARWPALSAMILSLLALAACAHPTVAPEYLAASANEPYRLASGDRLRIIVFGQDSLSNSYAVGADGRIAMPLIGPVEARGLTTRELEGRVAGRLAEGYLRDPRVSVEVETFRPFFILGEVNQSGQYPFVHGMTALTAVAIAGGFSPRAAQSSVDITRAVQGEVVTIAVPIATPLRPGDTVVVRERFF